MARVAVNEKGLRFARELRAAIRRREDNADLQAAIEVYDRAVTQEERQVAAQYLAQHATIADHHYGEEVALATLRAFHPQLLPPEER